MSRDISFWGIGKRRSQVYLLRTYICSVSSFQTLISVEKRRIGARRSRRKKNRASSDQYRKIDAGLGNKDFISLGHESITKLLLLPG